MRKIYLLLLLSLSVTFGTIEPAFGQFNPIFYASGDYYNATDSDAIAFISAAGITKAKQKRAIDYLAINLKSSGLWTQMQVVYPMTGGTNTAMKYNLKDPNNLDAAYRINWVSGGTFSDSGYQSNGASSYGDTFFVPSVVQNVNSNGLSIVIGVTNFEDVNDIGAYTDASQQSRFAAYSTSGAGAVGRFNGANMVYGQSLVSSIGVYTCQRVSSTSSSIWKNSVKVNTTNSGGTLPAHSIYIGSFNNAGAGPLGFSFKRIQSIYIHPGLSDADVATLHGIINTYENILGRKTW